MANLKPLIRFRSFQVDEKRRVLAALYEDAVKLEQQKAVILDTMDREAKAAKNSGSFEVLKSLGIYVKGARARIENIDGQAKRLDLRIELAQEDLREHFAELKKIEILHARRLEDARLENERREEAIMNEIGLTLHRRQEDGANA